MAALHNKHTAAFEYAFGVDFVTRFSKQHTQIHKLVRLRQTTTPTTGMNKLKSTGKKKEWNEQQHRTGKITHELVRNLGEKEESNRIK